MIILSNEYVLTGWQETWVPEDGHTSDISDDCKLTSQQTHG